MVWGPSPRGRLARPSIGPAWTFSVLFGLTAVLIAVVLIRPWLAGTNDPDSTSSVLYFERIVTGRHLEVTVLTTPKPLLTVLYGVAWVAFHDWRPIVWATIAVHGITVALASRLAWRLGGLAAAVFLAFGLIASGAELQEVARANSLPWALLGYAIAGWAVTGTRRRYGIAGLALLFAGLVRIETWVVVGAATAAIAIAGLPFVRRRAPASWPPISAEAPLLVAWLAPPIMLLHDLLLTGDPLYWLSVPTAYRALTPGVGGGAHFHVAISLALLAAAGSGYLWLQRRWAMLVGLGALVIGVLAFLELLSLRGTYIDPRYFEEPTLGLLVAGALGFAGLFALLRAGLAKAASTRRWRPDLGRWRSLRSTWLRGAAWMVVACAAAGLAAHISRPGVLAPSIDARFRMLQQANANLETVLPTMREVMATISTPAPAGEPVGHGFSVVNPRLASMYVPRALGGRMAVELDVPLTRLADSSVAFKAFPTGQLLRPGQYVYHDRNVDPNAVLAPYEVSTPTRLGAVGLEPIVFRPGQYWFLRVVP